MKLYSQLILSISFLILLSACSEVPFFLDFDYRRGTKALENKNYELALDSFSEVIKKTDPDSQKRFLTYIKRSIAYAHLNEFDTALEDLKVAKDFIKLYPNDHLTIGELFLVESNVYASLGHEDKVITNLHKAAEYLPNDVVINNNLGHHYNELGNYKEALKYLNKALEVEEYAYSYNNRALTNLKLGNIDAALRDIESSEKLYDQNPYLYENKAQIFFELNKQDLACEVLKQAVLLSKEFDYIVPKDSLKFRKLFEANCN